MSVQEKYQAVLELANQNGTTYNLSEADGVLHIDGNAPSEEAKQRLSEIDARLNRLGAEIDAMHRAAERDASEAEARVKAATEEEVRKIMESAEQEVTAAGKAARRELTRYAADLAVSLAREQIHVTESQDEALWRGFARQLSAGGAREDH